MAIRNNAKKIPFRTRSTQASIAEENAAWSPEDHDSSTRGSHEPVEASMLSNGVHDSQGKSGIVSNKHRLSTTWMGHERVIGLLQYGQDDTIAEDLAWAPDPVPDAFTVTSIDSNVTDLALHELVPNTETDSSTSDSSSKVPEANSEMKRGIQEVLDAIRAANPPESPKPLMDIEEEETQFLALRARIMAKSRRRVEKWLANVSTSNLHDPFTAVKPPSSYCFIVDEYPYELTKPDLVHLTPADFDSDEEARNGAAVKRFMGLPSKDIAPYLDIRRQLGVGKGKPGGSNGLLVSVPRQAH